MGKKNPAAGAGLLYLGTNGQLRIAGAVSGRPLLMKVS